MTHSARSDTDDAKRHTLRYFLAKLDQHFTPLITLETVLGQVPTMAATRARSSHSIRSMSEANFILFIACAGPTPVVSKASVFCSAFFS
jgi:hypothetical protein